MGNYENYDEQLKSPEAGKTEDGLGTNVSTFLLIDRKIIKTFDLSCETKEDYTLWTTVYARLSEVTRQITVYQGQINRYDSQVAYSTVKLSLIEVNNYSEVNTGNSYADHFGTAFREGWNELVTGVQDFTIWFAESLPVLILPAILLMAIVLTVRPLLKKQRQNETSKKECVTPIVPCDALLFS